MDDKHPLRQWRADNGDITLAALAKDLGVVPSHLSQIECGKRGASLEIALKIHDRTDKKVPLSALLKPEAA